MTGFFPGVRPADLIPGDPGELRWLAGRLGVLGDGMGEAAGELALIDGDGWQGAAAEAFRHAAKLPPTRYRDAAVGFSAASSAVLGYANALESAQLDAGRAITTHQDAESASAAWHQRQQAATTQALAAAANAHPGHAAADPPSVSTSDPGDQGRAQAESILQDARSALEAAAARLRATLADAQHAAPTMRGLLGTVDAKRVAFGAGAVLSEGLLTFDDFFAAAKTREVSGYLRGTTQVAAYRRSFPGQLALAQKLRWGAYGLSFATASVEQFSVDAGNKRYPLGEKLLRAGTAGGLQVGTLMAAGAGADAFVGIPMVASLLPEVGLVAFIPVAGEIIAIALITVAVGILINRFVLPTAEKEVFRAEHWAVHEGAHDVTNIAEEEAHAYVDDAQAVAHGAHAVSSAAVDVAHGAGRAGGAALHRLGNAKDQAVKDLKSGFGLSGLLGG